MKKTKKILSVFLALLMIFSSVPLSGSLADFSLFTLKSSAAEVSSGECGENLTWVLDDEGTLTISGEGEMSNYSSRKTPWYSCVRNINAVVIEDGVTSIGGFAFSDCRNLTSVTVPDGVTSIAYYAFKECSSLSSITIPNSVTSLGESVFQNCTSLTSIKIPGGVTSIANNAFNGCTGLSSITLADSVTSIGYYAFQDCTNLAKINIPDGITNIDQYAFFGCTALKTVNYGGSEEQWNAIEIGEGNDCLKNAPHIIVNKEEVAATCGDVGYEAGEYCIQCQEYVSGGKEIPATGEHELVPYDAQEASATQIGWNAYEACINCDYSTKVEIPMWPSGTCGENLTWVLDDAGTFTISGKGDMYDYLTGDETPWYAYRNDITAVVMDNSITRIGSYAFYECKNLTDVQLSNSLTVIAHYAFSDCQKLTGINLPASLESIGNYAFSYCGELTDINLPASLESIGNSAFCECYMLAEIVLPENLQLIGTDAFRYCTALTSISIPASIKKLEAGLFEGAENLESVTIPASVTNIGTYAFCECYSLETVYYGGTEEQWNAIVGIDFYNDSLKNVSHIIVNKEENAPTCTEAGIAAGEYCIQCQEYVSGGTEIPAEHELVTYPAQPSTATEAGWYDYEACENCDYSTKVEIPAWPTGTCGDSLTWVLDTNTYTLTISGEGAMKDYVAFDSIPWYSYRKDIKTVVMEDGVTSIGNGAFYQTAITSITIPEGVTKIGIDAFRDCNALTGITIPESVTNIAEYAFRNCDGLKSITIPKGVTCIANYTFNDCDNLQSVVISEGVTNIDAYAFYSCNSLTSVAIPSSVTEIGSGVFMDCKNIKTVYYGGSEEDWNAVNIKNGNENLTGATREFGIIWGTCGENLTWVLDTNTYILTISGEGAMTDFSNEGAPWYSYRNDIKTVVVEDGVTSIGSNAFYSCSNLTDAQLSNSLTVIGESAFSNCGLTSIVIPDKVEGINKRGFSYCYDLCSVTINGNLRYIGNGAFKECVKLTDINLPASLESIDSYAFEYCYMLAEIVLPENLQFIGEKAFINCTSLTNIVIPASITKLESGLFRSATWLESVTIPDSVTNIGTYAFYACYSLETVYYGGSEEQWNAIEIDSDNDKLINVPHVIVNKEEIAATCGDVGYEAGEYCIKCQEYVSGGKEIPANGEHELVPHDAQPSTATEAGWEAYEACKNCDYSTKKVEIPAWPSGECGDSLTWVLDTNTYTLTISGTGDMTVYLGEAPWYSYYENIKTIVIEDGVTSICANAFVDCMRLTKVDIPDSITSIGIGTFQGCTGIESFTIPDSITIIPPCIFRSCWRLKTVTIPDSITSIGQSAFDFCDLLETVYYGGNEEQWNTIEIDSIENDNLINAPHIIVKKEEVAPTCTEKGYEAGEYCIKCQEYVSGGKEIPATGEHELVTHAAQPSTATEAGWGAYEACKNCDYSTKVEIPAWPTGTCGENVTWVLDTNTYTLTISGEGDMADYADDASVPWSDYRIKITTVVIKDGVTDVCNYAFSYSTNLTNAEIPDSVTSIGIGAFYDCDSLQSITIPDSVTGIGDYAFGECTGLTSVTISDNVESIGEMAFYHCENITDITIPDGVESMGNSVFGRCNALTSITVPVSVTNISYGTFYGCNKLNTVYYEGNEEQWNAIEIASDNDALLYVPHVIISKEEIAATCTEKGYEAGEYCIKCQEYVSGGKEIPATGEHSYTYTLETYQYTGQKVTEICTNDGCNYNSYVYIVPYFGASYTGEPITNGLVLVGFSGAFSGEPCPSMDSVVYSRNGVTVDEVIDAGTYTASITYGGLTASVQTSVYKSHISSENVEKLFTFSPPANLNVNDGLPKEATVVPNDDGVGEVIAVMYFDGDEQLDGAPTAEGTYSVKIDVAEGNNYYAASKLTADSWTFTFEIAEEHEHKGGEATCIAQAICEVCQQPYGELNANNHKGETEIKDDVAATCGKDGYTGDTYCLDCQQKIATGETIKASGEHKEFIVKGRVEATYEAEGYTGDKYCKECDTLIEKGTSIPKLVKPTEPDTPNNPNKPSDSCDHICHSESGFVQFFWKIIRFLQKLFKIEQYCECGAKHW